MRSMRLGLHSRRGGIERAENLRMNMIGRHAPRLQAGRDLAQKSRGAAQIELAVMRYANLVECRDSEMPGRVEIDTASVGWSRPAVLNVAPAVCQLLQQST